MSITREEFQDVARSIPPTSHFISDAPVGVACQDSKYLRRKRPIEGHPKSHVWIVSDDSKPDFQRSFLSLDPLVVGRVSAGSESHELLDTLNQFSTQPHSVASRE